MRPSLNSSGVINVGTDTPDMLMPAQLWMFQAMQEYGASVSMQPRFSRLQASRFAAGRWRIVTNVWVATRSGGDEEASA